MNVSAQQLYEAMRKFVNKNNIVPHIAEKGLIYPSQCLFYCEWDQLYDYERRLFDAVAKEISEGRSEPTTE